MSQALIPIVLSVLLLASSAAFGQVSSVDASAAGTARLTVTDWETGASTCAAGAAVAVEVNPYSGAVAWDAPDCGGADAATFTYGCTDLCYHDCWTYEDAVSCWNDGVTADGKWFTDQMTLQRDGAFSHQRDVGWTTLRIEGNLLVATWPGALG